LSEAGDGFLLECVESALKMARDGGATDAECTGSEGDSFSVSVRLGDIETLTEAGSRGIGIRVLVGRNTGSAYTSDLSRDGIQAMVRSALDSAKITSEDPYAGLPEEFGKLEGDLGLYSPEVEALEAGWKIEQAKKVEKAALDFDSRISNSEGAGFDTRTGRSVFGNSRGFLGAYRSSSLSTSVVPVAKNGNSMERDYWFSVARNPARLESPEAIGRKAAERTLRRLGARKVATQKVPVVFEPRTANSLLGHIFEAVSGDSVYRHESFLAGNLGEKVFSDKLTVIDDATIPGLFGTSPFDDEGVVSRRTTIIEKGVLQSYLLNTYTARKLGLKTTGNASRGLTGNAGIGHGNLFFEPGVRSPEEIVGSISKGLLVTELMGDAVNVVNGDYSRGAAGIWIENGELAYPVSEITIAGTLQEMFQAIAEVGNDLEFRSSVASPTVVIGEMTVSGE
jgi:PmbA protein